MKVTQASIEVASQENIITIYHSYVKMHKKLERKIESMHLICDIYCLLSSISAITGELFLEIN